MSSERVSMAVAEGRSLGSLVLAALWGPSGDGGTLRRDRPGGVVESLLPRPRGWDWCARSRPLRSWSPLRLPCLDELALSREELVVPADVEWLLLEDVRGGGIGGVPRCWRGLPELVGVPEASGDGRVDGGRGYS